MNNSLALQNMDEIERAATAMSKSGYFADSRDQAQAITKILAGREMGFGPFAAMSGIYIISGRPSVGANLMAAAVKGSGKYDYRVAEMSDTACEIAFFEGKVEIGRSRFTAEDAKKAGTKNTDKFPRNMLFARAMSNGVRWYCPDVFSGAPTYTPEELGATIDEAGDVVDVPANDFRSVPPQQAPATTTPAQAIVDAIGEVEEMDIEDALIVENRDGVLYGTLDSSKLGHMANAMLKAMKTDASEDGRIAKMHKLAAVKRILNFRENEGGEA